jgi:serine/threonine-protein kinase RsbW
MAAIPPTPPHPIPPPTPPPPPEEGQATIHNRREEIDRAEETILGLLNRQGYPASSQFAVRLALEEALNNAFGHGHAQLPEAPVRLEYQIGPAELTLTIEDQGPGFDPDSVADPTLDENLENASGRGMLLIRAYMTSVAWEGRGNRIRMMYRLPRGAAQGAETP